MGFQNIGKVETADFYIDLAFRRAKEDIDRFRGKVKITTKLDKSKKLELERISLVNESLSGSMLRILKSFPQTKELPVFYLELLKCTLEYEDFKKSLGAVHWARSSILKFFHFYSTKIKKTKDIEKINAYRREFYGRVSSVVKQIKNELLYLDISRKIIKGFPIIKTSLPTLTISGFPNVGKTTLLYKLTGSKPEIHAYPFTTKGLNIGYTVSEEKVEDAETGKTSKEKLRKIQLIDTPGSLNRFNKMNNIEKQAYLAVKYCADTIIYIFDLTEPYPLEDQINLYEHLKTFDKKIILYLSKTDILEKDKIAAFNKKYKTINSSEDLKEILAKIAPIKTDPVEADPVETY